MKNIHERLNMILESQEERFVVTRVGNVNSFLSAGIFAGDVSDVASKLTDFLTAFSDNAPGVDYDAIAKSLHTGVELKPSLRLTVPCGWLEGDLGRSNRTIRTNMRVFAQQPASYFFSTDPSSREFNTYIFPEDLISATNGSFWHGGLFEVVSTVKSIYSLAETVSDRLGWKRAICPNRQTLLYGPNLPGQ